jgi:hypothetical protein
MALLTSSSRRFHRSNHYSHEQRRERIAKVRERIDLVAPAQRHDRAPARPAAGCP